MYSFFYYFHFSNICELLHLYACSKPYLCMCLWQDFQPQCSAGTFINYYFCNSSNHIFMQIYVTWSFGGPNITCIHITCRFTPQPFSTHRTSWKFWLKKYPSKGLTCLSKISPSSWQQWPWPMSNLDNQSGSYTHTKKHIKGKNLDKFCICLDDKCCFFSSKL